MNPSCRLSKGLLNYVQFSIIVAEFFSTTGGDVYAFQGAPGDRYVSYYMRELAASAHAPGGGPRDSRLRLALSRDSHSSFASARPWRALARGGDGEDEDGDGDPGRGGVDGRGSACEAAGTLVCGRQDG